MHLLVLTGYDDAMASVGDLVAPQHAWFARRHGFAFECVRIYEPGTHLPFSRCRVCLGWRLFPRQIKWGKCLIYRLPEIAMFLAAA